MQSSISSITLVYIILSQMLTINIKKIGRVLTDTLYFLFLCLGWTWPAWYAWEARPNGKWLVLNHPLFHSVFAFTFWHYRKEKNNVGSCWYQLHAFGINYPRTIPSFTHFSFSAVLCRIVLCSLLHLKVLICRGVSHSISWGGDAVLLFWSSYGGEGSVSGASTAI